MTQEHVCSRRRLLIQGVAFGTTVACGGNPPGGSDPEAFGTVSAGSLSDMPVGTLKALSSAPALLGRDAKGLYAMSSTCTHEGCDMIAEGRVTDNGVICQCHGSRFDANGDVVVGPATEPLAHFAVIVDAAGNISVDGAKRVGASIRTAVA
jgi:Rieske Fe-S protein